MKLLLRLKQYPIYWKLFFSYLIGTRRTMPRSWRLKSLAYYGFFLFTLRYWHID